MKIESAITIIGGLLALTATACSSSPTTFQWYRGNTHAHSSNSDGDSSPEAVAEWYKRHGYQFLFITDHETLTRPGLFERWFGALNGFLVLPGQEITQWGGDPRRSAAHVNALFINQSIWPIGIRPCLGGSCGAVADKKLPLAYTFRRNIAAILDQQGIAQVNHPNYRWSLKPSDLKAIPDGTLLEIWNGQGSIHNLGGIAPSGDRRPRVEAFWDALLSAGKIIWGVAADDSHVFQGRGANDPSGAAPGQAWIMVRASHLRPGSIKKAIAEGSFYSSTGIEIKDIHANRSRMTIRIGANRRNVHYVTRFIGKNGRVFAQVHGPTATYHFSGDELYVRAAITDSNGKRAWTQPVFLGRR